MHMQSNNSKTMNNPVADYLSEIGRKGAKTRWDRMSKEEREKEMSRRRKLGIERNAKKAPKE